MIKKFRDSIHSKQYTKFRNFLTKARKDKNLSQRELAERLSTIYSLIGKVETGDRRLDIFEFVKYCSALELNPHDVLDLIIKE